MMLESYFDDVGEPEIYYVPGALLVLVVLGGMVCAVLCFVRPKKAADPFVPFADRLWARILQRGPALGLILCLGIILMFNLLASTGPGLHTTKLAKTRSTMNQITQSFLDYETEYGKPPPARDPAGFIQILLDDNPRQIVFLNLRLKDLDAQGQALDGWGTPFAITFPDAGHLAIRSAGPDQTWHTPDDVIGGNLPVPSEAKK